MWLLLFGVALADEKPDGQLPDIPPPVISASRHEDSDLLVTTNNNELQLREPLCGALETQSVLWETCLAPADEIVLTVTTGAGGIILAVEGASHRTVCLQDSLLDQILLGAGQRLARCQLSLTQQGGHVDSQL